MTVEAQQSAVAYVDDHEAAAATKQARLEKAAGLIGKRVRATQVWHSAYGSATRETFQIAQKPIGTLERVDRNDANLMFLIKDRGDDVPSIWAYDIEPVESALVADYDAASETLAARKRPWQDLIQGDSTVPSRPRVRITQMYQHAANPAPIEAFVGKTGVLTQVDSNDPARTFLLTLDEETNGTRQVWAYDIDGSTVDQAGQDEVTRLRAEIDRLQAQVTDLNRQVSNRGDMLDPDEVKRVALEYAERHGWCSVVKDALRELGVETRRVVRFDYVIRGRVEAEYDRDEEPDEDWIRQSIRSIDNDGQMHMDGDLDNQSASDYDVEIRDLSVEDAED